MTRFLLIYLLLAWFVQPSWALEITFQQTGHAEDASIRLGDVATFDEQSPLTEALATQQVGQSPAPGQSLVLSSQSIQQILLATRTLPADVTWKGSPAITVQRQGIDVTADTVQRIVDGFIAANKGNLPPADIRFIPQALPLPFTLPKGELSWDVIPSNPGILSSSSFSIIFKVDGRVVKNMSIRGKIEALARVVVTTEHLKKGVILRPQHLRIDLIDISDIADPELNLQAVIGMQITRGLAAGTPLTTSMVESLPVVRRGQKVKLIVESGTLHLTATGFAHSDGRLDQMIKVQNINSNKTIHGRVTGPGVVEVIL